jgi:tetratricopeptide (TPR) repeat protein
MILPLTVCSQHLEDSIQSAIDTEAISRFDLGLEQISFLMRHRNDVAHYIEQRSKELKSLGDSVSLIDLMIKKGCFLQLTGSENEAILSLVKVLAMAERDGYKEKTGTILLRLGEMYEERACYDLALNAYNKSLNDLEERNDTIRIFRLYGDLAILYHHLQDTARTMLFLNKGRELNSKSDKNDLVRHLLFQTIICADLNMFAKSRTSLDSAKILVDANGSFEIEMLYNLAAGRLHRLLNDVKRSEAYLSSAIRFSQKVFDDYFQAVAVLDLIKIRMQLRDYGNALSLLGQSLELCEKNEFNGLLLDTYRSYIQIYDIKDDFALLAKYQDLYIKQKNKISSAEFLIKIASMQADFETREDVNLIEDQKELLALQERALEKKRQINIAIGFVVVLLSIILWILYNINKRKKAFNRNLDRLVSERTRDLEDKHLQLGKLSANLFMEMEFMHKEMQAQLSTLEGIVYLAHKDPSVVDAAQLAEVEDTIRNLKDNLNWLAELRNEREKNETGQLRE